MDKDHEIESGLMHRKSMPENAGMLLILIGWSQVFFDEEYDYSPLDIILSMTFIRL
ncbi:MAG: hypothetical protein R3B93_27185 [Bacteroidia bacterium]